MAGYLPSVSDLITEIRSDLDEAADTPGLWTDTELVRWLNRGLRSVAQLARETHENAMLRQVRSDDAVLQIAGQAFDPATLALTADTTAVKLPLDCAEVRSLRAISADDSAVGLPTFRFTNLSREEFRALRDETGPESGGSYWVDIETRTDGTYLVFAPAIGATIATELRYVMLPPEVASTDDLDGLGFSRIMLDAVVAYVVLEAMRKEGTQANIAMAERVWGERSALVTRATGPRQTQDPEVVKGWMEEWI